MNDEFHGQGGSYVIKEGKRERVEEPTRPTDTGGARDEKGAPLPGTEPPKETPAKPAPISRRTPPAAAASGD